MPHSSTQRCSASAKGARTEVCYLSRLRGYDLTRPWQSAHRQRLIAAASLLFWTAKSFQTAGAAGLAIPSVWMQHITDTKPVYWHHFMSCQSPREGVGQRSTRGYKAYHQEHRQLYSHPSLLSIPLSQMLLSQLLPLEPEPTLAEEDTKEGSSFGPQLLSSTLPFLPSGARAARPSLWRKTLTSRKWALPGDWAWKAIPRGCFGLKLDRIGTFSGLGC